MAKLAIILMLVFIGKLAIATTIDDLAGELEKESLQHLKPVAVRPSVHLIEVSEPVAETASQTFNLNPKRLSKKDKQPSEPSLPEIVPNQDSSNDRDEILQNLSASWSSLKDCLTVLKIDPRYRRTAKDASNIDVYVKTQFHLLEKIEANRSSDFATEKRRLVYANWIVNHKLSECEDLSDGPSKNRYVYLVGQQAKNDGKSFETIAGTLVSSMLKTICPGADASCARQIAFKQQTRKDDLISYLNLLSPGSMKYIAYIGHGWSYGFLLGFKDMSVPADWHPYAKQITNLGWEAARQGAIYSDDMNYIGNVIARALDPHGTAAIFACDTGDFVAPYLKGYLPATATVLSAKSGMEYKKILGTESWSLSLPTGEHFIGPQLVMYPDEKNMFGKTKAAPFQYSQDFIAIEAEPNPSDKGSGLDDMTSAVLTRIGRKEAWFDWVGDKADSKRLIVFDARDREMVMAIFKVPPPGHGLFEDDLTISFSGFDQRVKEVLRSRSGADRAYLKDLFERINACIDDGVTKYY